MQIVVLGMHRSGTSVVARLLNLMGAYFGAENTSTGASEENEKGFWERMDVRSLNDSILHNANCDWDRIADFNTESIPPVFLDAYQRSAMEIILNLDAHRPWFIKEPRLCVLFPVWRHVLEMPFCVHVIRNPVEVAQSLKVRNGIPIKAGLALWEVYNKRAIAASSTLPRHFLSYADLLASPQDVAEGLRNALASHCGYAFRVPTRMELEAFVDQKLYRQRSDEDSIRTVAKSQATLFELMKKAVVSNEIDPPPITKSSINVLRRFESSGEHLAARMRRSNARERSSWRNADPQLTLKSMELDRALADAANRRSALEGKDRTISQMRTDAQNYNTQLALKNQRIEQLVAEGKVRLAVQDKAVQQLVAEGKERLAAQDKAVQQLVAEGKERLAVQDKAVQQLVAERNTAASTVKSLTTEHHALTVRLAVQDKAVQQLVAEGKERLAVQDKAVQQLVAERNTAASTVKSLTTEHHALTVRLAVQDKAVQQLVAEGKERLAVQDKAVQQLVAEGKERLAVQDKAVQQLVAERNTAASTVKSLTTDHHALTVRLAVQDKAVQQLVAERNTAASTVKSLTTEHHALTVRLAVQDKAVQQLVAERNTAASTVKSLTTDHHALTVRLAVQDKAVQQLVAERNTAASTVKSLTTEHHALTVRLAVQDKAVQQLVAERNTAASTVKSLTTEHHALTVRLAVQDKAVQQLVAERNTAASTVKSLTTEHHALTVRLAVQDKAVEQGSAEIRLLKANISSKDQAIRASGVTIERLRADLTALQTTSQRAVRSTTEENVRLAATVKSLTTEHHALTVRLAVQDKAVQQLVAERNTAASKNDKLRSTTRRLEDELRRTNADLTDLAKGITDVFASRRWRFGHFVLSLKYRMLFRQIPPMAADSLNPKIQEVRDRHSANITTR